MICNRCLKECSVYKVYFNGENICSDCHRELSEEEFCFKCGGYGYTQPVYLDGEYEECSCRKNKTSSSHRKQKK